MKIFIRYIRDYFHEDFNLKAHILTALFLTLALWLNYANPFFDQHNRAYDWITDDYGKSLTTICLLTIFYGLAFYFTFFVLKFTQKHSFDRKKQNLFLLFGTIGLFFLSVDSCYYLMQFSHPFLPENAYIANWVRACISNLSSFISVILPLYIIYAAVRYFKPEFYGLRLNGAKVLPYFWLILFMMPLIILAGFQSDFLSAYPTYNNHHEYRFLGVDQWITVGIYELCYGFDFLSVELFFRGFMVIALSKFLGKDAILPMVAVYCFLHFGKPAGEAVSSIFGGYILGILAYRSRNIYGGLVAHLGVAWGMEYIAYLQLG